MTDYFYEPNPSIDEPEWEPNESWFYDSDDDDNEPDFDCGWDDERCQLAGTEDCDFECPYHDYYYGIETAITTTTNLDSTYPQESQW